MNSELPFGPFLVFGALISFFFSEEIIKWYSNLIL
jgi:prepilin signal peptidase PulO-like enzyme (type II secretory pathway)